MCAAIKIRRLIFKVGGGYLTLYVWSSR